MRLRGWRLSVLLFVLAFPGVARADGEAPPAPPNVEVLPPLAASAPGTPAAPTAPSLVVPLSETRAARRQRLKVRAYSGGTVPAEMHVETRYSGRQALPLIVGVPLFGVAYGAAASIAYSQAPPDRVLLIPFAGPVIRGVDCFGMIGTTTGKLSGLTDLVYFLGGVFGFVDGFAQVGGVVLTIAGIVQLSKGPQPYLVPDKRAALPREKLHLDVRPFALIGGTAPGIGVTITGF